MVSNLSRRSNQLFYHFNINSICVAHTQFNIPNSKIFKNLSIESTSKSNKLIFLWMTENNQSTKVVYMIPLTHILTTGSTSFISCLGGNWICVFGPTPHFILLFSQHPGKKRKRQKVACFTTSETLYSFVCSSCALCWCKHSLANWAGDIATLIDIQYMPQVKVTHFPFL